MAKLIACKTCGKAIASSAKSCPHCGAPNRRSSWLVYTFVVIVMLFVTVVILREMGSQQNNLAPTKPSESAYASAQAPDYRKATLSQLPNGTLLSFRGQVLQIAGTHGARIATGQPGVLGFLGEDVFLTFDEKPQVIEYDVVRILGRYIGTKKYETVLRTKREIPLIDVDYYYNISRGDATDTAPSITTRPIESPARTPGSVAVKPSFDCSKAMTHVEKTICTVPALATYDQEVAKIYRVLRAQSAGDITVSQRQWIVERDACHKQTDIEVCLNRLYRQRLALLLQPWLKILEEVENIYKPLRPHFSLETEKPQNGKVVYLINEFQYVHGSLKNRYWIATSEQALEKQRLLCDLQTSEDGKFEAGEQMCDAQYAKKLFADA